MMDAHETDLTVHHVLDVFRRRAPLVLVCFVVAVAAALAYSLHAQKQYTATASLLFNNTPLSQQVAGLQAVPNTNPQSVQDTNTELLKLGDLAQKTAARVGHGLSAGAVAGSVAVSPQGDTTLVNLSSTLASPTLAAQVANTYANVFVNEQENGTHQYYESALATVEAQVAKLSPRQAVSVQGLALESRAQSLATLAQLRNDTVSLAQAAGVPGAPSAPSIKRDVILAGLLGLLVGIALAFGVERLDQNLREPEELESTYGLPLLGAVPQSSALRRGSRGSRASTLPGAVADAFQFIRVRLQYFNVDRDLQTLAIVSAQSGDGKTTIAHCLADAAAASGSRALLIEVDLRRPTLAEEVGVASGPGLADVLIGSLTLEDVFQTAQLIGVSNNRDDARNLDVVVAGALPPNPAEMLESNAMLQVLQQAKDNYDFVVIDTPPVGAVSDSLPLMSHVDGVVIVAGMGQNRRDIARRLAATLRSIDAPLIGVIANRVKPRGSAYYGYGYGYPTKVGEPQPGNSTSTSNGHVPAPAIARSRPLARPHSGRAESNEDRPIKPANRMPSIASMPVSTPDSATNEGERSEAARLPAAPDPALTEVSRSEAPRLPAAPDPAPTEVSRSEAPRHRTVEPTKARQLDSPTSAGGNARVGAATRETDVVQRWLGAHPRLDVPLTRTAASRLNVLERRLAGLTDTKLKRTAADPAVGSSPDTPDSEKDDARSRD